MKPSNKEKLLDYLDERGKITVAQAMKILDVEENVAREVLDELAKGAYVSVSGEYYYYHPPA